MFKSIKRLFMSKKKKTVGVFVVSAVLEINFAIFKMKREFNLDSVENAISIYHHNRLFVPGTIAKDFENIVYRLRLADSLTKDDIDGLESIVVRLNKYAEQY